MPKEKDMFEMFSSLFSTVGEVHKVYTFVDFYTYIKGVEYLICIGFFVGFPLFYKFINRVPGKTDRHQRG